MKVKFIILTVIVLLVFGCNSEKKKSDIPEINTENSTKTLTFQSELIDLRDVNLSFTEDYTVEKFGMQKLNDSIYHFVLKLDQNVTNEVVEKYSIGFRGYYDSENIQFPSSPLLETKDDGKYIIVRRKVKVTNYLDSLDMYIYDRKNWKGSGKLGQIRVKDILFEKQ